MGPAGLCGVGVMGYIVLVAIIKSDDWMPVLNSDISAEFPFAERSDALAAKDDAIAIVREAYDLAHVPDVLNFFPTPPAVGRP